jgi:RNA recognition motif-containing protein
MNKKLYVGNLVYECTDDELKGVFAAYGNVVSAAIIKFRDSGKSKGFGFVEMETEEAAQKAIDMFNQQDYKGRKMIISEAKPPKKHEYTDMKTDLH